MPRRSAAGPGPVNTSASRSPRSTQQARNRGKGRFEHRRTIGRRPAAVPEHLRHRTVRSRRRRRSRRLSGERLHQRAGSQRWRLDLHGRDGSQWSRGLRIRHGRRRGRCQRRWPHGPARVQHGPKARPHHRPAGRHRPTNPGRARQFAVRKQRRPALHGSAGRIHPRRRSRPLDGRKGDIADIDLDGRNDIFVLSGNYMRRQVAREHDCGSIHCGRSPARMPTRMLLDDDGHRSPDPGAYRLEPAGTSATTSGCRTTAVVSRRSVASAARRGRRPGMARLDVDGDGAPDIALSAPIRRRSGRTDPISGTQYPASARRREHEPHRRPRMVQPGCHRSTGHVTVGDRVLHRELRRRRHGRQLSRTLLVGLETQHRPSVMKTLPMDARPARAVASDTLTVIHERGPGPSPSRKRRAGPGR